MSLLSSTSADLSELTSQFIENENGSSALSAIVIQVHQNKTLMDVVSYLGPYLTNAEKHSSRSRASLLLAELFFRLPQYPLTRAEVLSFLCFFLDRGSDPSSVYPCIRGLLALIQHHQVYVQHESVEKIVLLVARDIHVPSLPQAQRQVAFEMIDLLLTRPYLPMVQRVECAEHFFLGFVEAMKGEKDPRNLLKCLHLAADMMTLVFPHAPALAQDGMLDQIFNVTSCYFPITFKPPPNDPYGITSEDLALALRNVFSASLRMFSLVLPLLCQKLNATVMESKLDAVKTLAFVLVQVQEKQMSQDGSGSNHPPFGSLQDWQNTHAAFYREMIQSPETPLSREILGVCTLLSEMEDSKKLMMSRGFLYPLLRQLMEDVSAQRLDSMIGINATRALQALAKGSISMYRVIVSQAMPIFERQLKQENLSAQHEHVVLQRCTLFIDIIDQEVSYSSHPIQPFVQSFLLPTFRHYMTSSSELVRKMALVGFCHLISYPPSLLLDEGDVEDLVICLSQWAIAKDGHEHFRDQVIQQLMAFCARPTLRDAFITRVTLPLWLAQLDVGSSFSPTLHAITCLLSHHETLFVHFGSQVLAYAIKEACFDVSKMTRTVAIVRAVASMVSSQKVTRGIEYCIYGASLEAKPGVGTSPPPSSLLFDIVQAVKNVPPEPSSEVSDVVQACETLCRHVTQHASLEAQAFVCQHIINTFVLGNMSCSCMTLFTAFVSSFQKSVMALFNLPQVLTLLLQLALSNTRERLMNVHASQALASIINKMDQSEDMDTLMDHMLKVQLAPMIMANEPCATKDEVEQQSMTLQTWIWITKALVLRCHPQSSYCLDILSQLIVRKSDEGKAAIEEDVAIAAASGLELILNSEDPILSAAAGATRNPFYLQKVYHQLRSQLVNHLPSEITTSDVATLMALSHLLCHVSKSVRYGDLDSSMPILVKALKIGSKERFISSTIRSFRVILIESPKTTHPFLDYLVPALLRIATESTLAKDRYLAIDCVATLGTFNYSLLHPHKRLVLKGLARALDDAKRPVRKLAVKVRNQWSIL